MTDTPARLLDQLHLPEDLRTLDPDSLRRLAAEIREEIIKTISENGGHLGASLGVVELTIALHAELNTPTGRHQSGTWGTSPTLTSCSPGGSTRSARSAPTVGYPGFPAGARAPTTSTAPATAAVR